MWKILSMIFTGIIVSFYYFPFEFSFFPGYNTKMLLAAIGLLIAVLKLVLTKKIKIPRNILLTMVFAVLVSVVGFVAVIYNGTPDYVYSSYVISMLVWLSAAFVVCCIIKQVHGVLTVELICNYLIAVCLAQCVLAQIIDSQPEFKRIVDAYINQGQRFLIEVNRLYGIGASLDVAGTRFAVALICLVYVLYINRNLQKKYIWIYIAAYITIAILGSMIARTTYVGIVISVIFLLYVTKPMSLFVTRRGVQIIGIVIILLTILALLSIHLYNTNPSFQKLMRFAFEGFFNLAETGEWTIASSEKLRTMYVYPDNLKTWIIGDGYFNNPINVDPYYVGEITGGYYKGTDVGYLRFIFYFGLIGLFTFMLFFVKVSQYCVRELPKYKWMFIMLLLANFVIWFKVSTDVFLAFALFLCVTNMQDSPQQLETES